MSHDDVNKKHDDVTIEKRHHITLTSRLFFLYFRGDSNSDGKESQLKFVNNKLRGGGGMGGGGNFGVFINIQVQICTNLCRMKGPPPL